MKRVFVCLLALFAVVSRGEAFWLVYSPYAEPAIIQKMPDGTPDSFVPPAGMHNTRQPFAQPVCRVDGTPVRRPLLPSIVADPADRALILRDYQHNGFALMPFELSSAVKRYQRIQFHDIAALRDLRLREENATVDDYRRYVAEEIKIHAMLFANAKTASTQAECSAIIKDYVARLRRRATVEKMPA